MAPRSFVPAIAAAALLAPAISSAAALEFYVDPSASSNGSGTSWADPFDSLQYAINQTDGDAQVDRIYVRSGTISGVGGSNLVNIPGSNIEIIGSYDGAGSPGSRTIAPEPTTILDAAGVYERVVSISAADNIVFDGFVVRNGSDSGPVAEGAGIAVINWSISAAIRNCVVEGNSLTGQDGLARGAGIYIFQNSNSVPLEISDVVVRNNTITTAGTSVLTQGSGAGIFANIGGAQTSVLTMTNVTVEGNTITAHDNADDIVGAGAALNWAGNMTITGSSFSGNTISYPSSTGPNGNYDYQGGGLYLNCQDQVEITDSEFTGNLIDFQGTTANSNVKGGGLFAQDPTDLRLERVAIAGNEVISPGVTLGSRSNGAAISTFDNTGTGTVEIVDSKVIGNSGQTRNLSLEGSVQLNVINSIVAGNSVIDAESGIRTGAVNTTVVNSLFYDNYCVTGASAIQFDLGTGDSADVINSIFIDNVSSGAFPRAALARSGSANPIPNVNNCLFENNDLRVANWQPTNYVNGADLNVIAGSANNLDGAVNFGEHPAFFGTWTAVSPSAGSTTLTNAGSFAGLALAGELVRFNTTDPAVGDPSFAYVVSNDDDSITVAGDLTGLVSIGDDYEFVSITPKFPSNAIETGASPAEFAAVPADDLNGTARPIDGDRNATPAYDIGPIEAPEASTGNIRYVDPDIASPGDGSSWDQALDNLQTAINQAADEADAIQDVVYVKGATTMGNIGNASRLVQIGRSNVRIEGGYLGTGSPGPRDLSESGLSVLDATVSSSEKVLIINGEDDIVVDGFVITGGLAMGEGAGISCSNVGALTVANSIIENNTLTDSVSGGAGIYVFKNANSDPIVIENTIIRNNSITGGATMYGAGLRLNAGGSESLAVTMTNVEVSNNVIEIPVTGGEALGAGAHLSPEAPGSVTLEGCTFHGNAINFTPATGPSADAGLQGAAVYFNAASGAITINDSEFTGNRIVYNGDRSTFLQIPGAAGIYVHQPLDTTITNSVFANNFLFTNVLGPAIGTGAAIRTFQNTDTGSFDIENTMIVGNYGGGRAVLGARNGTSNLRNLIFAGNVSYDGASALHVQSASNTISNVIFTDNFSTDEVVSLSIDLTGGDSATVANAVFNDSATEAAESYALASPSEDAAPALANNLFTTAVDAVAAIGTEPLFATAADLNANTASITAVANLDGAAVFRAGQGGTWSAAPAANAALTRTTLTDTGAFAGLDLVGELVSYNETDRPNLGPALAYVIANDDDTLTVAGDVTAWVSNGDAYEIVSFQPAFPSDAIDNGTDDSATYGVPVADFDGDAYTVDIIDVGNDGSGSFVDIGVQELAATTAEAPTLDPEPGTTDGTTNDVSWNAVPSATSYFLEVSTDASFANVVQLIEETTTSATVSGLNSGVEYWYRVRAIVDGAPTPVSNIESSTQAATSVRDWMLID